MGAHHGVLGEVQASGDRPDRPAALLCDVVAVHDGVPDHPLCGGQARDRRQDQIRSEARGEGVREVDPVRRLSEVQEELRQAQGQVQVRSGSGLPGPQRVRLQEPRVQQRPRDPMHIREEVRTQDDLPLLRGGHRDEGGHAGLRRDGRCGRLWKDHDDADCGRHHHEDGQDQGRPGFPGRPSSPRTSPRRRPPESWTASASS